MEKYTPEFVTAMRKIGDASVKADKTRRNLIQHMTILLSTIAAVVSALLAGTESKPSIFLVFSLGVMILSIIIGVYILWKKISIDSRAAFESARIAANFETLDRLVESGKLIQGSEEHRNYLIALLVSTTQRAPHLKDTVPWAEEAKKLRLPGPINCHLNHI